MDKSKEESKREEVDRLKNWLETREIFGIKLGLDNTYRLLEEFDNPQDKVKYIHVGGTNGKGSTTTYISNVLREAGYKVGSYTSPYIVSFNERFQINNENISDEKLANLLSRMKEKVEKLEKEGICPTYFEVLTVMTFIYFYEEEVDFGVLEVGLGGSYDSTNVIKSPLASVITSISLDHVDILGDTIEKISKDKAGIIKKSCPVFIYPNSRESLDVMEEKARKERSDFYILDKFDINIKEISIGKTVFDYKNYKDIEIGMWGDHQALNASLASMTLLGLREMGKINFTDQDLYRGLKISKIVGRLEEISKEPRIIIDGAHNLDGIQALKKAIKTISYRKLILGLGILEDKDHLEIIRELIGLADKVVVTEVPNPRSLKLEDIKAEVEVYKEKVYGFKDYKDALKKTIELSEEGDLILWCGSLYLIGNIRGEIIKE